MPPIASARSRSRAAWRRSATRSRPASATPQRRVAAGRAAMAAAGVEPEYLAAVDPDTLEGVREIAGRVLVVVAARVGPARLIDNVLIDTEQVATHA